MIVPNDTNMEIVRKAQLTAHSHSCDRSKTLQSDHLINTTSKMALIITP